MGFIASFYEINVFVNICTTFKVQMTRYLQIAFRIVF